MSVAVIKNILKKSLPGLGAITGGVGGNLMSRWENEHVYNNDTTKALSTLTGTGMGATIGGVLFSPKLRAQALKGLFELEGAKQLALFAGDKVAEGVDAVKGYTSIQNELANKNAEITKNQLETAKQNKEIANISNETSQKWLDLVNKGLPYAGGLAALMALLYAYNSFKTDKRKNNVALQIPEEKLSPQFYSRLGREILFKDRDENGRILRKKYIKDQDDDNYVLPDYQESAKLASISRSKYSKFLDDVRSVVDSVNNAAGNKRVPEAKVETIGRVLSEHPSNKTWDATAGKWLTKYGPKLLEHFGFITPSEEIKQLVRFTDPHGRSRMAPSLSADSRYADPNAILRLADYAQNRLSYPGLPYFTHNWV